jgi:hypothetical protein
MGRIFHWMFSMLIKLSSDLNLDYQIIFNEVLKNIYKSENMK